MFLPFESKDPNHQKNYEKRLEYATEYKNKNPLNYKEITKEEEIKQLKDYELLFVFLPARMGTTSFAFAFMQDNELHYYRTDEYNCFKALKETFPLFDHLGDITADAKNDNHNYERKWVYIWFWGWVLVRSEIFDDFNEFVESKRKEFWFDAVSWTWYHTRDVLAKMYYDGLKKG